MGPTIPEHNFRVKLRRMIGSIRSALHVDIKAVDSMDAVDKSEREFLGWDAVWTQQQKSSK